ncbi:uncharacterized protein [Haliotis cracherodii]|uniref:uncharacterized protein n=1 Tax=Haliotis cracherodii TaxID=6455 RepID=UPI0039ED95D0
MLVRNWVVWTAALYIYLSSSSQGITEATCDNAYGFNPSLGYYKDKKIEQAIRRRGNATGLMECLLSCNRLIVSHFFYNQATQDCICAMSYPGSMFLVDAPGYDHYTAPGFIQKYMWLSINASSAAPGFTSGGRFTGWRPTLDDEAPWVEIGVDVLLYVTGIAIAPNVAAVTKNIWFRDANGTWRITWKRNDEKSKMGNNFIPHCLMLPFPTEAVRITVDNHSSAQILNIQLAGRM